MHVALARRRAINLGMATSLLALVMCLVAGCGAVGDRPGLVLFPDMNASVPYDAYDANSVTATGQTLLLPPDGTVPIGAEPFLFGVGPEEAARAGELLVNPLSASDENLARARVEFANKCEVCHGPTGNGDGPIIGRFPNPPMLTAERARTLPDGTIYHIISRGQGIMPSHAAQVLPIDRWRLVMHIRKLQADVPFVATAAVLPVTDSAPIVPAPEVVP